MIITGLRLAGQIRIVMVLVIALAVAALAPTSAPAGPADQTRVIVELNEPPALAEVSIADHQTSARRAQAWERAGRRAAELERDQLRVVERAGHQRIELDVVRHLTAAFNGLVLEVQAAQLAALEALPEVRAVHPDTLYTHAVDVSVPLVGATEAWELTDTEGQQLTGAGRIVAVLDTGVDYRHPDLGGGFGPEHKVVGGYDLVNNDPDPMDDHGHGTHVAGIIAADGTVRGVAPDAALTAYKVLNQFGTGQLSDILAGLDEAVRPDNPHRADVVNLSLGGPGDGSDPLSVAASQAVDAGVVVVSSAGNNGPFPQSVTSPAAGEGVLAVGASVSGVWVPRARVVAPIELNLRSFRLAFSADPPAAPLQLDVVDVGLGFPGSYDHLDVTGKAVLIDHIPDQTALEKVAHAEERGAAAALVYVPDPLDPFGPGPIIPFSSHPVQLRPSGAVAQTPAADTFATGFDDGRLDNILAMSVPGASAAMIQSHLAEGDVTIQITAVDATDQLAAFSSRGPSGTFSQKPELVAPGVEVLSTLPDGSYGRASGTSMAGPHVAGAAAMLRQLHPDWTPEQISAAMTGAAQRLDDLSPLEQGAGRLDIPDALTAEVLATPSALSFGLADVSGDRIDSTRTTRLTNVGTAPASLSLSTVQHNSLAATVTVDPAVVHLEPGDSADVTVRIELAPPGADADVTGWMIIDDGSRHQAVPFLLAIRHLGVHATPDPAPADAQTSIFIASPATLSAAPAVEVTCPGLPPQHPPAQPFGTDVWRAAVDLADPGVCQVSTTATTDERYGKPVLTGQGAFEAVPARGPGRGVETWQPIGPNAASGWLAFGIARNPNQMAVLPTGSPTAFVTSDRMRTWRELRTMPMAGGNAVSVAVRPRDGGQLYVAVDGFGDGSYRGRIMHTDDGGASWRILPGPDESVRHVALDDSGDALAVVTGDHRLRITVDDGLSWTELPSPWGNVQDLHWIGPDLYLGTLGDGLFVVRGATGPNPADPEMLFRPGLLGFADHVTGDESTIVVSTWPLPTVFVSHDDGATFEAVHQVGGTSFQALELIEDDIYAVQPNNLWIGAERGARWEPWGTPVGAAIEFDIASSPWSDEVFVASRDAGIYAASSPGEYQRVGVPGAHVFDLATAAGADGEVLLAGTVADTFRTPLPRRAAIRPDDLEWESSGAEGFIGTSATFVATSPADPSVVYKVRSFEIHRSDDGGVTWQRKAGAWESPFALLVHPADPDRIYVSYWSLVGEGLVVSTDGGETWRKVDHGRTFGALAGDPTDPNRMWAGEGFGFGRDGLWLSEDGGLTFERLSDVPVTAIAVDPAKPDRLTLGGRALYTSNDGGKTMIPADHVNLDMRVTDIEFAPGDTTRLYASAGAFVDDLGALKGGRGVLVSEDGGSTWESFTTGLSNPNVTSLAFDGNGQYLFAGVSGGSVHRIMLDE